MKWQENILNAARKSFLSPLALAGVKNKVLVVLGADCELMLRWVEDVEQQVTLAGAADRHKDKKLKKRKKTKTGKYQSWCLCFAQADSHARLCTMTWQYVSKFSLCA